LLSSVPTSFVRDIRVEPGGRVDRLAAASLALVTVAGVAAASGGYFPTSWGWTALLLAWVVIAASLLGRAQLGRLGLVWSVALLALAGWAWLSAVWGAPEPAVLAGQRLLVYVVAVPAALLLVRRRDLPVFLGGLVAGATGACAYGLATRLEPDRVGSFGAESGYRLFEPLGYWNALGVFAGLALLVALALAAHVRSAAGAVAVSLAPIVLLPTLYFTFSRGAWLALAVGGAAALALSPRRLRLATVAVVLLPLPAVALLLASRLDGLTNGAATLAQATHDGHRLLAWLGLLAVAQLAVGVALVLATRRVEAPARVRRVFGGALAAAAAIALVAVFVAYDDPVSLARRGYDSFTSPPAGGADLNSRLFTFSNNGRIELWHAAWADFEAYPVVGSGAGGFERWWVEHRQSGQAIRDAHNLYAQTLGELGIVGLALLVAVLAVPLAAGVRARRHPLAAVALGAYVAYLVHAFFDWDWQVPALTLLALFCGAAVVVAARSADEEEREPGPYLRYGLAAGAACVAMVAFVGLVGNIALSRAEAAVLRGDGQQAADEARRARRWMPWSAAPLKTLGEAQVLLGRRADGVETLRRAAQKDPGDWEIWLDIAAVTRGAERTRALDRAAALNPRGPEIADVRAQLGGADGS
jgi:O-antigen ligase